MNINRSLYSRPYPSGITVGGDAVAATTTVTIFSIFFCFPFFSFFFHFRLSTRLHSRRNLANFCPHAGGGDHRPRLAAGDHGAREDHVALRLRRFETVRRNGEKTKNKGTKMNTQHTHNHEHDQTCTADQAQENDRP